MNEANELKSMISIKIFDTLKMPSVSSSTFRIPNAGIMIVISFAFFLSGGRIPRLD